MKMKAAPGRGRLAWRTLSHHYIDSDAGDAAGELQKLGGVRVIPGNGAERTADGEHGAVGRRKAIRGGLVFRHCEGFPGHIGFSALSSVHPMIEKYPTQPRSGSVRTDAQRRARWLHYKCLATWDKLITDSSG